MDKVITVTAAQVAIARLQVKRDKARGRSVDPAIEAIANAQRRPQRDCTTSSAQTMPPSHTDVAASG